MLKPPRCSRTTIRRILLPLITTVSRSWNGSAPARLAQTVYLSLKSAVLVVQEPYLLPEDGYLLALTLVLALEILPQHRDGLLERGHLRPQRLGVELPPVPAQCGQRVGHLHRCAPPRSAMMISFISGKFKF